MRRIPLVLVSMLLASSGCPEDEPAPSGPPICEDCDNAESCPGDQPNQNPLEPCDEADAACFYCGPQMRRYVCQPNGSGELRWQDAGEADMCPPPPATDDGGT
ncbi:MAG: hypothetical protein KDK70_22160 [Myxococcales bacterium]|nr:hypothetical protein [Myxococcales bacterium]